MTLQIDKIGGKGSVGRGDDSYSSSSAAIAGVTVVACLTVVACIQTVAGILAVAGVL